MRSDLVFGALSHVSNRYQLCQLASKATRKLHKPNTRLQDTTNEVLGRFQTASVPGSCAFRSSMPHLNSGEASTAAQNGRRLLNSRPHLRRSIPLFRTLPLPSSLSAGEYDHR